MDMMTRRAMMPNDNYIKNGLVLWMDGIDKGNISGAWVDKASGHIFTNVNGMTNGDNYVGLNSASMQYLRNSTFATNVRAYDATIEVVISDYTNGSMIFFPSTWGRIAFGVRSSTNHIIWCTGRDDPMVEFNSTSKIFSITYDDNSATTRAIVNGANPNLGNKNFWDGEDGQYNYIGCRNKSGNYYYATAKIHAIRIYDRKLTVDEMRHNQRVDNKRFHLGLMI